jgi:16S rRNA (cytosine1402-N4)-methyltransferase
MNKQKHVPVLAREALDCLKPAPGDRYLDLTAGYGGHASLVLQRIGENGSMTLVDRDEEAIKTLKSMFGEDRRVEIIHKDFLEASEELLSEKRQFDIVFADLGVSSPHLDNPDRGFSFASEGPLDMRMDRSKGMTAEEVVNTYDKDNLAELLKKYGEVRGAHRIASRLIEHRPYKTTTELAKKVVQFHKGSKRIHPATKVFQALRIEVNKELEMLEKSLDLWVELLAPHGRIGVISFHSLEDRLVKQALRDYGGNRYDARLHIVTKKAVTAAKEEIVFNPRARSAKLRVAQRK